MHYVNFETTAELPDLFVYLNHCYFYCNRPEFPCSRLRRMLGFQVCTSYQLLIRPKMKTIISLAILVVAQLIISGNIYSQQSTFEQGDEGWTVTYDGVGPYWYATGGNPGGYCSASDGQAGAIFFWTAPAPFLGNMSAFYHGFLSFDLSLNCTEYLGYQDIVLTGNGITLYYYCSYYPTTQWTHYAVFLDTIGWQEDSGGTWITVTSEDFQSVLGNLSSLQIRGEYCGTPDISNIDNVCLSTSATPVSQIQNPGSLVNVYPNPFSSVVTVTLNRKEPGAIGRLRLKDILGHEVFTIETNDINTGHQKTVDPGGIAKGVYFLEMMVDDVPIIRKIVKN
jgi:hypothetical protein